MSIERIYLVTGSSRGLGEALANALVAHEAVVVGIARGASRTLEARAASGARVEQVGCDLAAVGDLDAMLSKLLGRLPLGRCTLVALINNAGILEPVGSVGTLDAIALERHFAVNLVAPAVLTNVFLRETAGLSASRRILNVSSGAARHPIAGWGAYCASKAGLDHLARTVAAEQREFANGARIVSLAPGVLDTDMQAVVRAQPAERFPQVGRFLEMHRTGALVSPDAAAGRIATFLHAADFGREEIADLRQMAS